MLSLLSLLLLLSSLTSPSTSFTPSPPRSLVRTLSSSHISAKGSKGFGSPPQKSLKKSYTSPPSPPPLPSPLPLPCRCGSKYKYSECCHLLHASVSTPAFSLFPPEAVVRSRYAAYSLSLNGYIIDTTSPRNDQHYEHDRSAWLTSLEKGEYKDFILDDCVILSTTDDGEGCVNSDRKDRRPTVKFEARFRSRETGLTTAFVETSVFEWCEKVNGWTYLSGEVGVD